MKSFTHTKRLSRAIALTAVLAGLAVPAAFASLSAPSTKPMNSAQPDVRNRIAVHPSSELMNSAPPDVANRTAATHPSSELMNSAPPDVRNRTAATHPSSKPMDSASPDVRDRVAATPRAHQPEAAPLSARLGYADLEGGPSAPVTIIDTGGAGFDWADAGIGAGFTLGLLALLGVSALVANRRWHRLQLP